MSKELEALKYFYTVSQNGNHPELVEDAYRILKDHLTPPTADEVCKALSDYFGFYYYYQDGYFYKSDGIKYIYPLKVSGFTEIQLYDGHLPPHLITLIGRFYEGLEKGGDEE